jgi:hypothetical protein
VAELAFKSVDFRVPKKGILHLSTLPPERAGVLVVGKVLFCLNPQATKLSNAPFRRLSCRAFYVQGWEFTSLGNAVSFLINNGLMGLLQGFSSPSGRSDPAAHRLHGQT